MKLQITPKEDNNGKPFAKAGVFFCIVEIFFLKREIFKKKPLNFTTKVFEKSF